MMKMCVSPRLVLVMTAMVLGVPSLFRPFPVFASSFVFEKKVLTIPVGQTVTMPIIVDPNGEQQYTVRLLLRFPPEVLEMTAVTLDPRWIALAQSGYDFFDPVHGTLTKTGGFPKGFLVPQVFGSVTFRAKRVGEAVIDIGGQSFVLNAEGENTLQSLPRIRVGVVAKGTFPPTVVAPGTTSTSVPVLLSLPDLPVTEQNLFDILSEPVAHTSRPPIWVFVFLFSIGVVLAILCRAGLIWYRRRRMLQKIKKEKL